MMTTPQARSIHSTTTTTSTITPTSAKYCYLDLDLDHHRAKLGRCAAFVHATDARYGFSSKDLRALGGSELARIPDLFQLDHEWGTTSNSGRTLGDNSSNSHNHRGADDGLEVRPPPAGSRIVVQLYWDVAPLACENFATLCYHGTPKTSPPPPVGNSGKPLTYRNSTVHRVQTNFVLQAGDFVKGNGSAGESIYGKKFKDERAGLLLKHDRKGVLSMGNSGKNSNSSQFFFTLVSETPQCNGKHVIFGHAVSGLEVLDYVHELASSPDGTPTLPVTITDCGIWEPLSTPGAGYWYDQPDPDAYGGSSPVFMVRPRVAVVAPNEAVVDRVRKALGSHAIVVWTHHDQKLNSNANSLRDELRTLLDSYSVDVVLVAPACHDSVIGLELPWGNAGVSLDEVILESKPVDALTIIQQNSWLATKTQWQLDGVL